MEKIDEFMSWQIDKINRMKLKRIQIDIDYTSFLYAR